MNLNIKATTFVCCLSFLSNAYTYDFKEGNASKSIKCHWLREALSSFQ